MKQRMLCFAVDSQINLISTHLFLWALSGLLTHVSLKSVSAFVRYSANRNIILKNTIWDEEDHCWTARYSHWELNKWLHVQFLLHVVLWSWHAGAFTLKCTCLLVNTNSTATYVLWCKQDCCQSQLLCFACACYARAIKCPSFVFVSVVVVVVGGADGVCSLSW